jgi:rRNA 2'-O-methyltransferase fibrillarin (EC 2.1.1.-)
LVIKAMSIDVTKEPSETFKREIDVLKDRGYEIWTWFTWTIRYGSCHGYCKEDLIKGFTKKF